MQIGDITGLFQLNNQGAEGTLQLDGGNSLKEFISSLVPGQTLQGVVVSEDGKNVLLKLMNDMELTATLSENTHVEAGSRLTFEVKNNGKALVLSPLFTNTSSDANEVKALDMAGIPVNSRTIQMARNLMEAGLPIDRKSLSNVFRESVKFSAHDIDNITTLHKLDVPVTEENLNTLETYNNLQHSIVEGLTDVFDDLFMPDFSADFPEVGEQVETALKDVAPNQQGKAISQTDDNTDNSPQVSKHNQTVLSVLDILAEEESSLEISDKALQDNLSNKEGMLNALQNDDNEYIGENKPMLQEFKSIANVLSKEGILVDSPEKLLELLKGDKEIRDKVKADIIDKFMIKPEDFSDMKKVNSELEHLTRKIKEVRTLLENEGATGLQVYKTVSKVDNNIDFINQLNNTFNYIQIPLKLNNTNTSGELYVMKNRKNRISEDGSVSAVVHLDMPTLGPVDVYVKLSGNNVSTNFTVVDDETLSFLEEHMDILNKRLEGKGYLLSTDVKVSEDFSTGLKPILGKEKKDAILLNSFDVRA